MSNEFIDTLLNSEPLKDLFEDGKIQLCDSQDKNRYVLKIGKNIEISIILNFFNSELTDVDVMSITDDARCLGFSEETRFLSKKKYDEQHDFSDLLLKISKIYKDAKSLFWV